MDVLLWLIVAVATVVLVVSGLIASGKAPSMLQSGRFANLQIPAVRDSGKSSVAKPLAQSAAPTSRATSVATAAPAQMVSSVMTTAPITPLDDQRLDRLEARVDRLERELVQRLDILSSSLREQRRDESDRFARLESLLGRQDESLRRAIADDIAARAPRLDSPRLAERRAEAVADLYGRLARFEAALAQASTPVLLPGEAYAPPAEITEDVMVWDNWKDVGDRAFALADAVNAQRLQLSSATGAELTAFITLLRGQLTRSIYPNVGEAVTAEQRDALRAALVVLAVELPKVRRALDTEYRSVYPSLD